MAIGHWGPVVEGYEWGRVSRDGVDNTPEESKRVDVTCGSKDCSRAHRGSKHSRRVMG
jgi:hypothetical protein